MDGELKKRTQTTGEELANTISHALGALLALAGAAPLLARGVMTGSAKTVFSLGAYALSLVLLYTASAVYHAVRNPEIKRVLRVMDHCSIFVLILGTYIPMSLLVVGGRTGWMLFLTNTTLAVIGITLNAIDLKRFDKVSLALYALMGWLIVAAGNPPEYNKSVRDFDVVTLDRVKRIDVEEDFAVWKEYARQRNIHGAIISYLDIKKDHFYRIETTADGLQFATARGWEDLSELIRTYETLHLPVGREVVGQYIQLPRIAKDFTNYLELYYKYRRTYHVEDILKGTKS